MCAAKVATTYIAMVEFEQELRSFWDTPVSKEDGAEIDDERSGHLYQTRHYREMDGRYVVPTPGRHKSLQLEDSCYKALRHFLDQQIKMAEKCGAQKETEGVHVRKQVIGPPEALREDVGGKDATTMKLRNLFNASNLSSNGIRLNQKILLDPKL